MVLHTRPRWPCFAAIWDELYEINGGDLHPIDPEWVREIVRWYGQAVLFEHMWGGQYTLRDTTGFAAMAEPSVPCPPVIPVGLGSPLLSMSTFGKQRTSLGRT